MVYYFPTRKKKQKKTKQFDILPGRKTDVNWIFGISTGSVCKIFRENSPSVETDIRDGEKMRLRQLQVVGFINVNRYSKVEVKLATTCIFAFRELFNCSLLTNP